MIEDELDVPTLERAAETLRLAWFKASNDDAIHRWREWQSVLALIELVKHGT